MSNDDRTAEARALYRQAIARARDNDLAPSIRLLEQALDLLEPRRDIVLFAKISGYLARLLNIHGDNGTALNRLLRVLALVDTEEDHSDLWHRDAVFAVVQAHIFFVDMARDDASVHASKLLDVLDAADDYLEQTGFTHWRDGVLSTRAQLLDSLGEEREAIELQREAIEVAEASRDKSPGTSLGTKRRQLVRMLRRADEVDEAEALIRQMLADPAITGLDRLGAYHQLGHLLVDTDDDAHEAVRVAEQAVELSGEFGLGSQCAVLGLLVEALQKAGDYERCMQAAERHLELAKQHGVKDHLCGAYEDMTAAHINLGNLDVAEDYLEKGEALAAMLDEVTERTDNQDDMAELRERLERAREA